MIIIDGETEKGKGYHIQPNNINTQNRFWDVFGDYQSQTSARLIVKMCQESGGWIPFTQKQIDEYTQQQANGGKKQSFNFYKLCVASDPDDEKNFVILGKDGRYRVTHEFIAICFKSSPVI